jgi:hypothetical protein
MMWQAKKGTLVQGSRSKADGVAPGNSLHCWIVKTKMITITSMTTTH